METEPSKNSSESRKKVAEEKSVDNVVPEPVSEIFNGERVVQQDPPIRHPLRLLVVVLFLGWTFNYLFWKQSVGVNFALFLVLSLISGALLLFSEGYKPHRNILWLLIIFLFFGVISFLRQEPLTMFLAFMFTLVAAGLLATSYRGGRWHLYRLSNYLEKSFLLISDLAIRPIIYFAQVRKGASKSPKNATYFPVAGVMRGLVIALPIVICFGSLLASADLVFNQKINDFFDAQKITEKIAQLLIILSSAYFLAGAYLHAVIKSRDEKITREDKSILKPFLGFPESAVVLGSVAFLFLTFVVVQFQYFFGGQTNIGVEGFTYSQYARRGFNELVIVAFFSLVLILGLSTVTRRENDTQKRIYSGLSVIVVALVMVILISAYQRISLAIDWHGFSRLRLYPRVFLIWLGILLVVVAILEIFHHERYFAFAAVLASIGFAVSLTSINVDAAIVSHNVPRVLYGKNLNVAHLASLSMDAVPALVKEFNSKTYPQWVHEGVGAALTCYLHQDSKDEVDWSDWRSYNLSRWQAHDALQNVEIYLQEYSLNDRDSWDVKVKTPGHILYPCHYYESTPED
jgi:hypothetical protein